MATALGLLTSLVVPVPVLAVDPIHAGTLSNLIVSAVVTIKDGPGDQYAHLSGDIAS